MKNMHAGAGADPVPVQYAPSLPALGFQRAFATNESCPAQI